MSEPRGGGGAADGGAAAPRPLVQSLVVAERVGRGYDLVRVGNFTEQGGGGAVADIAFFHDRATLDAFVADARADERAGRGGAPSAAARGGAAGRARCVRECCGALRDVCDGVFGVDAARVTLFYAPGALSRFVRQKLLFNVEPVEQRKRARALRDAREDAFVCVSAPAARAARVRAPSSASHVSDARSRAPPPSLVARQVRVLFRAVRAQARALLRRRARHAPRLLHGRVPRALRGGVDGAAARARLRPRRGGARV